MNDFDGAAYVFVFSGTTWTQQAKLTPADAPAGASFGVSASLSGDRALIGAYYDLPGQAGSAYTFLSDGGTWT